MRLFRRKKTSLKFADNFPRKKPIVTILHEPISAIATALTAIIEGVSFATASAYITFGVIKAVLYVALAVGGSLWSMGKQKKGSGRALGGGGQIVNTRSPSEPVKICYGLTKIGTNWIFCESTGLNNDDLWAVMTLGEGEISGIPKIVDDVIENKTGSGQPAVNDLSTRGTYTGGSNHKYEVLIFKGISIEYAAADDGGVWTDESSAARNDITNDMNLFPAVPVVDDAYVFGRYNPAGSGMDYDRLIINVSTPGTGTYAVTWEYWGLGATGAEWKALSGVSDGTNAFKNSGENTVSFTKPSDAEIVIFNSLNGPVHMMAIRARFSSGAFTAIPKAKQAWLADGAGSETYKWNDGSGWSAETALSTSWATLSNGVEIKFDYLRGHKPYQRFQFFAGDAIWLGERLMAYYKMWDPYGFGTVYDLVSYTLYTGTSSQTVDPSLNALFPQWKYALRHTAYIIFKFKTTKVWIHKQAPPAEAWSSVPEAKILVEGKKIYDTRTSTTAYSRNPALVWYDIMTNDRYAFGLGASRIDATSVNEAANWCDANGYFFDGSVVLRENIEDVIEDILACFRGYVIRSDGKYKLKVFTDDAPALALTENDIEISPESFEIHIPGVPESPNRTKIAFFNAELQYTEDFAIWEDQAGSPLPPADETPNEMPLIGITNYTTATELTKYYNLRNTFNTEFPVLGHPRCFGLEPGDTVSITHSFPGWTGKKVRVKGMGYPQNGLIPMKLIDEDASIYNRTVDVATRTKHRWWTRSPSLPTPAGFAATTGSDEYTENKADAYIECSWTNTGAGLDYYFYFQKSGDTAWDIRVIKGPNVISEAPKIRLGGLITNTVYKWKVSAYKPEGNLSSTISAEQTITTWQPVFWDKFKNILLNGSARIDQRQNSPVTMTDGVWAIGPDRWYGKIWSYAATATGQYGKLEPLGIGHYGVGFAFNSVTATTPAAVSLRYRIESANAKIFAGLKASLSCVVYHNVGSSVNWAISLYKANAADNFSSTTWISTTGAIAVPSATETRLEFPNIDLGNCGNGLEIIIEASLGTVSNKSFYITDCQFELGEICTPVEHRRFEDDLRLCQRYYCKSFPYATTPADNTATIGYLYNQVLVTNNYQFLPPAKFPVEMRTIPTLTFYNPNASAANNIYCSDASNHPETYANLNKEGFTANVNNSSIAAGLYISLHWTAEAEL